MTLTRSLVISTAAAYPSAEALRSALTAATQQMLDSPGVITSAATGGGSSYSRTVTMTPAEKVDLLAAALSYKETGTFTLPGSPKVYPTQINVAP